MPDNVPQPVKLVIERCWAQEPSVRPSASEAATLLRDLYATYRGEFVEWDATRRIVDEQLKSDGDTPPDTTEADSVRDSAAKADEAAAERADNAQLSSNNDDDSAKIGRAHV